ncbi:hypothetical protein PENSUB_455 [Penicillium subrubescens]|uniref:Uncharacterized protein n=1 Tax=Penicillium subrubescens TaxID=1316194 RepID=A0A1Q5UN36_9EURO|nr:hypothetical protein PENSUB_455 [Penicillium subrubescens]
MAIARSRGVLELRNSQNIELTTWKFPRIHEEEELFVAVDARTESLQSLRELGPPDLVYLVKQPKANSTRQTGVYHHVTGIDASSSASLAAYVNTLTFSPLDKTHKVVSGIYWLASWLPSD